MTRRAQSGPADARRTSGVACAALAPFVVALSQAAGMSAANAAILADVYVRSTLRGVGHHDICDLPLRIAAFREGRMNPDPRITPCGGSDAVEAWDGDNGPGELCAVHVVQRAQALASCHGIGLATIRSSNHFLAAAPYVQMAAERGYLAQVFSRSKLVMGVAGRSQHLIGNQPLGYGTPSGREAPLLLDICLAYASVGSLDAMRRDGRPVPAHWGNDASGVPTTDPAAIMEGGVSHPIGGHKGFGLALLVEVLTAVLSGGPVVDEPHPVHGESGVHAQTAVVIDPMRLLTPGLYEQRVATMLDRIEARAPDIAFPGARSHATRARIEQEGTLQLDDVVLDDLDRWADRLGVPPLPRAQSTHGPAP